MIYWQKMALDKVPLTSFKKPGVKAPLCSFVQLRQWVCIVNISMVMLPNIKSISFNLICIVTKNKNYFKYIFFRSFFVNWIVKRLFCVLARVENRWSDMYILFLYTCADNYIQHNTRYHGRIDGRHAERREFHGRTRNIHEYRWRG